MRRPLKEIIKGFMEKTIRPVFVEEVVIFFMNICRLVFYGCKYNDEVEGFIPLFVYWHFVV